jgi:hypothetical protein
MGRGGAIWAGAARVDITPEPGVELMGYGARRGVSTRVHDPIQARALALGTESGPRILVAAADLCLVAVEQARSVRGRIGRETGIPPDRILLSCSHTHSGPDTGLGALVSGRAAPPHVEPIFDGIVRAAREAHEARRPARLGWGRAEARIGRNRRVEDGPLDPEILLLRVDAASGAPLATLYSHACHGTVLGHDNLEISADWAGVTSARVEAERGGPALFLLGAHADIDPRTRGLMDLAIPGQSLGLGFEAVEVLGGEVADAILEALPGIETEPGAPLDGSTTTLDLALHPGAVADREAERDLDRMRRELVQRLGIPPEEFPRLSELFDEVRSLVAGRPVAEARELIARARLYFRDKTGPFHTGGKRSIDVEAQVLRIGDAALLALPLEPTAEVGLDWKRRARARGLFGGVCGIGNGWLRYLPHPRDLEEPLAHQRYEILMSLLAPPACERLLDAGDRLLDRLLGC